MNLLDQMIIFCWTRSLLHNKWEQSEKGCDIVKINKCSTQNVCHVFWLCQQILKHGTSCLWWSVNFKFFSCYVLFSSPCSGPGMHVMKCVLCARKPVYVQMCTSVSICRVRIQTYKMTMPLRRNTTHQQCTGKRLSRALVVLYQWKIGMPHLCDSTVARPALPRDNALVNRREYPLFCYPRFFFLIFWCLRFYDVCGLVAEDGNMMFGAWVGNTLFVAELWGFAWGTMRLESSKTNTLNQRKNASFFVQRRSPWNVRFKNRRSLHNDIGLNLILFPPSMMAPWLTNKQTCLSHKVPSFLTGIEWDSGHNCKFHPFLDRTFRGLLCTKSSHMYACSNCLS